MESAVTEWPRGIDEVVSNFGMKIVDAAVQLAIEQDADTDTRSNRDVDQIFLASSGAPSGFAEGSGVAVIFHGHIDLKGPLQIPNETLALPLRKEIHVAELSGERIQRSSRTNSYAGDCFVGLCG